MATPTKSTGKTGTPRDSGRAPKGQRRSGTANPPRSKKASHPRKTAGHGGAGRSTVSRRSGTPAAEKSPTPPAASVAAAQKVLRAVERRENRLRTALKRHKKAARALAKNVTAHRATVKDLKSDLKKVRKTREAVSAEL